MPEERLDVRYRKLLASMLSDEVRQGIARLREIPRDDSLTPRERVAELKDMARRLLFSPIAKQTIIELLQEQPVLYAIVDTKEHGLQAMSFRVDIYRSPVFISLFERLLSVDAHVWLAQNDTIGAEAYSLGSKHAEDDSSTGSGTFWRRVG
jgi:hypothetical protein